MLRRVFLFIVLAAAAGACANDRAHAVSTSGSDAGTDGSVPANAGPDGSPTADAAVDLDGAVPSLDGGDIDAASEKCGSLICPTGTCRSEGRCDLIAFITDQTYFGDDFNGPRVADQNATGIARLDSACQESANNADLSGTFIAWAHQNDGIGPLSFPANRLASSGYYALLDGTLITTTTGNLAAGGPPLAPIALSASNRDWLGATVWTGLQADGNASASDCSQWSSATSTAFGSAGVASSSDQWLGVDSLPCGTANHLYCFQKP